MSCKDKDYEVWATPPDMEGYQQVYFTVVEKPKTMTRLYKFDGKLYTLEEYERVIKLEAFI